LGCCESSLADGSIIAVTLVDPPVPPSNSAFSSSSFCEESPDPRLTVVHPLFGYPAKPPPVFDGPQLLLISKSSCFLLDQSVRISVSFLYESLRADYRLDGVEGREDGCLQRLIPRTRTTAESYFDRSIWCDWRIDRATPRFSNRSLSTTKERRWIKPCKIRRRETDTRRVCRLDETSKEDSGDKPADDQYASSSVSLPSAQHAHFSFQGVYRWIEAI
jgi:hypothetical protein